MPSGEKATELIPVEFPLECPSRLRRTFPVAASHSFSVSSKLPDSTRAPSGEKAAELTVLEWPSKVRRTFPVAGSHNSSDLSPPADSTRAPSGEKAAEVTRLDSLKERRTCPVAASDSAVASPSLLDSAR